MAHPNSLKNLKPFQKGTSGFAGGAKKHLAEELKGIKTLTPLEVNKTISKYARMILSSLNKTLEDPTTPALELAIAKIFERSIFYGDFNRLSFLLDRCIGRAPVISEEDDEEMDARLELSKISMNELLTLVKPNISNIE